MNNIKSLQQFLSGYDRGFDRAMANGKVQLMRLKNIAITIDGKQHKDKNLFDLFLKLPRKALDERRSKSGYDRALQIR